jgi:alcohol dehydrogenase class IV
MFKDFTFFVPRLVFGIGSSKKLSELAKKLGCSRALCIYDKGVKSAGVIDPIIAALNDGGISTVETDEVMPDPSMDLVDKVAKLGRDEKVDIVIAIGGGSSIDTGKTARMLMTNPGKASDYIVDYGVDLFKEKGLPYIVVPTTAGTGSEVTFSSVLTDTEKDRKVAVRDFIKMPVDYAVLDPEVTIALPPKITAACGMDVLTHATEAFLKPTASPLGDAMNIYATEMCMGSLEEAVKNGRNIEARARMMIASTMAGIGMASSGVHLAHGMAHAMGTAWHLSHGVACALALPYMFEHVCEMMPEKTKKLAKAMGIDLDEDVSPKDAKDVLVNRTRELSSAIGIPTAKELGLTVEKDLDDIIRFTAREQKLCQQSIRPFTGEDSERYYRDLLGR